MTSTETQSLMFEKVDENQYLRAIWDVYYPKWKPVEVLGFNNVLEYFEEFVAPGLVATTGAW